jgi:hypothetical protein
MPAEAAPAKAPLADGFATDAVLVPVVVNAGGLANATFRTHVALLNPTSHAFSLRATLHDSAGIAYHATIELPAGGLVTYENFLDELFHFAGAGAVRLESENAGADDLFIVNAEVYTTGSGVRYGTSVAVRDGRASGASSFSAGVTIDPRSRANVGCADESGAANTVRATLVDADGHEVSHVDVPLAANGWKQAALSGSVAGGFVRFEPHGPASCYAVVVDNGTNDGRFVAAVEYSE